MSGMTAKERFAFAEKRKEFKKRSQVTEELVTDASGKSKLIYARKGLKIGELRLS